MGDGIPQEELARPPMLLADGNTHPVIYVRLRDPDGVPQLASEEIEVLLVSSDPRVLRVPDYVFYVRRGRSYIFAPLTTTSVPGEVTITAVSRQQPPVTAQVETVSPLESMPPFRLAPEAAP